MLARSQIVDFLSYDLHCIPPVDRINYINTYIHIHSISSMRQHPTMHGGIREGEIFPKNIERVKRNETECVVCSLRICPWCDLEATWSSESDVHVGDLCD